MEWIGLDSFILSVIGAPTSDLQKQLFCNMYNFVLDPVVKLPAAKDAPRSIGEESHPAITAFQAVFRKQFRVYRYIDFGTACEEAEADFRRALTATLASSNQVSARETRKLEASLVSTRNDCKKLLCKLNNWMKNNFMTSAKEDSVQKFEQRLRQRYPTLDSGKFYEAIDLRKGLEELKMAIVMDFATQIPFFEQSPQVLEWCEELRLELGRVIAAAIAENRRIEESWKRKFQAAVASFKTRMTNFFYNNPFAKPEAVECFYADVKASTAEDHGLAPFLSDPGLKFTWESRVEEKYKTLETKWKGEGDRRIEMFRSALWTEADRLFADAFNVNMDHTTMKVRVAADAIRHQLEKASMESTRIRRTTLTAGPIAILLRGEKYEVLIPAGERLPTRKFHKRIMNVDNQTSGALSFYEGKGSTRGSSWKKLGNLQLTGIPSGKEDTQKLDLDVKIDALGMLRVEWKIRSTGKGVYDIFKTSVRSRDGRQNFGSSGRRECSACTK